MVVFTAIFHYMGRKTIFRRNVSFKHPFYAEKTPRKKQQKTINFIFKTTFKIRGNFVYKLIIILFIFVGTICISSCERLHTQLTYN